MKAAVAHVQPRLRWVPTVAAIVVIAATSALGRWQVHRAAEKQVLQSMLEARTQMPPVELNAWRGSAEEADALRFRSARVHGHFLPAGQIFIDNRSLDTQSGYHVLTPLDLGGRVVLVNRGFLARDASYPKAPQYPVPTGEQEITGQLSQAHSRFLELSQDTVSGAVWQNFKLERYAAVSPLPVLPLILLASSAGPGLKAVVETPDANIDMHRGYAFQWFAMAATTAALYLYFTFFRKAKSTS